MSADNHQLILSLATRKFGDEIGDFMALGPICLPRHDIPGISKFPFDQSSRSEKGSGFSEMTWPNQPREPVNVSPEIGYERRIDIGSH